MVRNLTYHHLENLRIAHENIEASKKCQLFNRSLLPAYAPTPKVDVEAKTEEIQQKFPLLPELASDRKTHIKTWQRAQKSRLWKRLVQST